jgi:multicomponent Na+:H+ antiporter subunit E
MIKRRITIFVLAAVVWLLLNWSAAPEQLIVAALVGIFIAWISGDLFGPLSSQKGDLKRALWFVCYFFVFIWECVKANVDSALRLLHPVVPINPGIVKVKTALRSDAGLTFLANSLTLKPGTMTVDIDKEKGFLYVHWADVKSQDIQKATELVASKFERILKRIFD